MAKKETYDDVLRTIASNYEEIEHSIANQLLLNIPSHYPTEGSYREKVWKSLFEIVIPKKYCIEQGVFIIDSIGHKSNEVDLAIYDELYTPYIFNYGEIKFIPIEAVAAVVQCKSRELKKEDIKVWAASVDDLITSMDSVVRMVGNMADNMEITGGLRVTQTATRPVKILCSLAGNQNFSEYNEMFDIILSVDTEKKKLLKNISKENQSLEAWNSSLNHAIDKIADSVDKVYREGIRTKPVTVRQQLLENLKIQQMNENGEEDENVILSLIFQLNQLLMVINNPMLFPHHAYANQFNKVLKKSNNDKGEEKDGQQKQ